MANRTLQIDVLHEIKALNAIKCNLYTPERCVNIWMDKSDYETLIDDGFFLRDGKDLDSANVLNTTNTFIEKK